MALTDRQTKSVIRLFSKAFVSAADDRERKKILLDFEDTFGRNILGWEQICKEQIEVFSKDAKVMSLYVELINRKDKEDEKSKVYEIRNIQEKDLPFVRELLNAVFDMSLTSFDNQRFQKYLKSGYSYVLCDEGSVLGVVLAYAMPSLSMEAVYIDNFAVAESMQGCGIGRRLFDYLCNAVHESGIWSLRLQTEKTREAYEIYKHWGFEEVDMVQMKKYVLK